MLNGLGLCKYTTGKIKIISHSQTAANLHSTPSSYFHTSLLIGRLLRGVKVKLVLILLAGLFSRYKKKEQKPCNRSPYVKETINVLYYILTKVFVFKQMTPFD